MSDILRIFGKEFEDVTGIKAKNNNEELLKFTRNNKNIDISDSTITADRIMSGYIGYDKRGNRLIGTAPSDEMWRKIAETTVCLDEYTNTSAWEGQFDTGITTSKLPYAYFIVFITCDSDITTDTEWGMTTCLFNKGGGIDGGSRRGSSLQIKGTQIPKSNLVKGYIMTNDYGVCLVDNKPTICFDRKAHSSIPKIRGGNYTVSVYGLQNIGYSIEPVYPQIIFSQDENGYIILDDVYATNATGVSF